MITASHDTMIIYSNNHLSKRGSDMASLNNIPSVRYLRTVALLVHSSNLTLYPICNGGNHSDGYINDAE